MIEIAGGCQCGAVRYTGTLGKDDAYFCHCRMCQRATGGVAAALVNARRDAIIWSGRPRDLYRSSPFAQRAHCALCGTPLTYEYDEGSEMLDLTAGSLDNPGVVRLTSHFGVESWVPGWISDDALPHMRADAYPPLVERWAAVHKAE